MARERSTGRRGKATEVAPDAYDGVCVHGVLPLVLDADTGALRLAEPGRDAPESCLVDPGELPEARIDLVVMPDVRSMDAWEDGLLENASNAMEASRGAGPWRRVALLVRRDKDPRPGSTLDEVVALRLPLGGHVDTNEWRRSRGVVDDAARRQRDADDARAGWRREIDRIEAFPLAGVDTFDARDDGGLPFEIRDPGGIRGIGRSYVLTRDGETFLASWRARGASADQLAAFASEVGLTFDGESLVRRLPTLEVADLEALDADRRAVDERIEAVEAFAKAMRVVETLRRDPAMMDLMRKACRGGPVAGHIDRGTCHQFDARLPGMVEVGRIQVRYALDSHVLMDSATGDDEGYPVHVASPVAVAIVRGDMDAAAKAWLALLSGRAGGEQAITARAEISQEALEMIRRTIASGGTKRRGSAAVAWRAAARACGIEPS